jgi:hypothetical protein
MGAKVDCIRVMAVKAVQTTALQEDYSPVTWTIYEALWKNLIDQASCLIGEMVSFSFVRVMLIHLVYPQLVDFASTCTI